MAERPIPELPMPVPVTRHLNRCSSLFHRASEPLSLRASRVFPLSTCQLASLSPRASACPHVPLPTCPLATFGRVKVSFASAI